MAQLEGSISTYVGEIVTVKKGGELTCEVRLKVNLSQRPGGQKSRDMNKMEHSFINNQGNEIDAHKSRSSHCLARGIVAG